MYDQKTLIQCIALSLAKLTPSQNISHGHYRYRTACLVDWHALLIRVEFTCSTSLPELLHNVGRVLYGRKSRGRRDESSQSLEWRNANANCTPRFCHASKFQTSDCSHYNAV